MYYVCIEWVNVFGEVIRMLMERVFVGGDGVWVEVLWVLLIYFDDFNFLEGLVDEMFWNNVYFILMDLWYNLFFINS